LDDSLPLLRTSFLPTALLLLDDIRAVRIWDNVIHMAQNVLVRNCSCRFERVVGSFKPFLEQVIKLLSNLFMFSFLRQIGLSIRLIAIEPSGLRIVIQVVVPIPVTMVALRRSPEIIETVPPGSR